MRAEVHANPEWFLTACKKLAEIEENAADYEDPEEGDKAPTKEVFDAVRAFLTAVKNVGGEAKLEVPHMFVSPSGNMVLTYGNKTASIDLRFSPEVFFSFKKGDAAPVKGEGLANVVGLVGRHFRV
jgi:hypothetical protein